jgi:hypothetical protein
MKTYTAHNTKLVHEDSWKTKNKKPHVVIDDAKNGHAFVIKFGKYPSVSIWRSKENGDLVKKLAGAKIPKRKK